VLARHQHKHPEIPASHRLIRIHLLAVNYMLPRLILPLIISTCLHANEAATAPTPPPADKPAEKPTVEKIDDKRYRVGKIEFDSSTREIRIPAKVNMAKGLLEFLIVHENGKIHEALFTTDTSPSDINLAITLLRYKPSPELYALPSETGGLSGNFPVVPEDIRAAARVSIDVEWAKDGKPERIGVNEWIQHATTSAAMPSSHWVYGGSQIEEGRFVAESTGDIAAIFLSNAAMINYPGKDNGNDTVWLAFENRVPPEGTNLTLIIAPYPKPQSTEQP
jgi:hypothetical protein